MVFVDFGWENWVLTGKTNLGSFGLVWARLGSFGLVWAHLGSCGLMWAHVGSFGLIWAQSGLFDLIWAHLGLETVFYFFALNTDPCGNRTQNLQRESDECYHLLD